MRNVAAYFPLAALASQVQPASIIKKKMMTTGPGNGQGATLEKQDNFEASDEVSSESWRKLLVGMASVLEKQLQ